MRNVSQVFSGRSNPLFTSNDSVVEGQLGQGFQNTGFTKRPEKFLVYLTNHAILFTY